MIPHFIYKSQCIPDMKCHHMFSWVFLAPKIYINYLDCRSWRLKIKEFRLNLNYDSPIDD